MKIVTPFRSGKHCFVIPYGKNNKALKIFHYKDLREKWKNDILWGDPPPHGYPNMSVSLREATKIQNICWIHGLAPRVYDIIGVCIGQAKHLAQVTDWIEPLPCTNEQALDIYKKVKELGEEYGFKNAKNDVQTADIGAGGVLLDFNTFHFTDNHIEKIKGKYINLGRYGKIYYHNVPEWGLVNAPRKNEERTKWLGLGKINFKGKDVIDIGCAGGFFCRHSKDREAGRVIGIDHGGKGSEDPIKATKLLSNELEYWDVDFFNIDIQSEAEKIKAISPAHIVFFLSMNFHVGIPDWLPGITKEVCVFEDNSKERNAKEQLEKMFTRVELVGHAEDHGNKPVYHAWK